MNDVMPAISLGCTCFLKISAGIALLWISKAFLAFTERSKPIVYTTIAPASTTGSTAYVKLIDKVEEALAAEEEEVECGACHQLIKTPPISQAEHLETYHCEHCGAKCQVPL